MGRRPEGEQALTGAERQARYRLRPDQTEEPAPVQAMPRRLSRGPTLVLPEATRDSATGEALQAMVDLDLEEIMAIQPPRGFGRDQT